MCLAAALYAANVADTDPFRIEPQRHDHRRRAPRTRDAAATEGLGLGVDADRADLASGTTSRRRQPGPRRRRPAALWRAHLAADRRSSAVPCCVLARRSSASSPAFSAALIDLVLLSLLDVLWAFPVYLLAISLSIVLITKRSRHRPVRITAGSLMAADRIIGLVYVPYVARPIRGQVLALKQQRVRAGGASDSACRPSRILLRDILPNVDDDADRLRADDDGAQHGDRDPRCRSCRSACSRRMRAGARSSRTGRRCSTPARRWRWRPGSRSWSTVLALNILGDACATRSIPTLAGAGESP